MRITYILLLPLTILMACTLSKQPKAFIPEVMVDSFNSQSHKWQAAVRAKDYQFIADFYDDDAIFCPPQNACHEGKVAITEHWEQTVNLLSDFKFKTLRIRGDHERFYEHGISVVTFSVNDSMVTDTSKYLLVWETRGQDDYKIIANMFN